MTTNNLALYKLLVKFGASEDDAARAATVDTTELATKADLADLKASLIMWMIGVMIAQTGLFLALVRAVVR